MPALVWGPVRREWDRYQACLVAAALVAGCSKPAAHAPEAPAPASAAPASASLQEPSADLAVFAVGL